MLNVFLSFFLISGTAKIAFLHHGNQSLTDNSYYTLRQGDEGYVGNSFHRTLDTHEYYHVPVDIHISGCLTQSYSWGKNDRGLLGRLRDMSEVWLIGGSYAENIMPYMDSIGNKFSTWYIQQVYDSSIKGISYYDIPNVLWIPERVYKSEALMPYSLIKVLNEEYGKYDSQGRYLAPCIVLDDNALSWYCSDCNPRKVYRMFDNEGNYVFVVFIQKIARDNMVWQNVSDPSNPLNQLLWNLHNDSDQEQIVIYGDDWEKAAGVAGWDFGQAGVPASSYDANIAWVASQDWVQPVHIGEAVKWWGVDKIYDSDPNNDPPSISIDYATYQELNDWTGGTYDNWYNDFKGTQAYGCGLAPDLNGNGINGDYEDLWKFAENYLINAPDNNVAKLGWVTLMGNLYETAWHTGPGGELVYWGKNVWNHTRYGALFAYAAMWLDSIRLRDTLSHIDSLDLDADGINEYVIYNSKVFAVFDKRGGRGLLVVNDSGQVIVGNLMTYFGGEGDFDDGAHQGLFEDSQGFNSCFEPECFIDNDTAVIRFYEAYNAQGDSSWDITKEIRLAPSVHYFEARYQSGFENWVKSAITPDVWENLLKGYSLSFISGLSPNGWMYAGYENTETKAKGVYLWASGEGFYYHNVGKTGQLAEIIELGGKSGNFTLYFYAGSGTPDINAQGPGDREGPMIYGTSFTPWTNILSLDSVLVTSYVQDPSGISSCVIHYGVNGNWSYPDITMHRDDGSTYDFNGNGLPDTTLYGAYIPPMPDHSHVEFVIHAEDASPGHYDTWDNNYGRNYSYTVGYINFEMDGNLDRVAKLYAQNGDMHLFLYYYRDSTQLYLATEAAGGTEGTGIFQNDHFILVGTNFDSVISAMWAKRGSVPLYDFYLADENDNDFVAFFDRDSILTDTAVFRCASSKNDEGYLEGVVNLRRFYGKVPDSIFVVVLSYETQDSGNLQWEVPRTDSLDNTVTIDECLIFKPNAVGVREQGSKALIPVKYSKGYIEFSFNSKISAPYTMAFYDILGRRVKILKAHAKRGKNSIKLPFGAFKKGVYFTVLRGKEIDEKRVFRFVIP